MIKDFVLCARAVEKNKYSNGPEETRFLLAPASQLLSPKHKVSKQVAWSNALRREATWDKDARTGLDRGDILIFMDGSTSD